MSGTKKVLCFGNEYLREDSMAKELAAEIKIPGVEFVLCNNADDVLDYDLKNVYILDVARGVSDVMLLDDIDRLKESSPITSHDFDLSFVLKLLKQLNGIEKVNIIAIPESGNKKQIKDKITKILTDKN